MMVGEMGYQLMDPILFLTVFLIPPAKYANLQKQPKLRLFVYYIFF